MLRLLLIWLLLAFTSYQSDLLKAESSNINDPIGVYDLQCEYLTSPIGIDIELPRFTWKLHDPTHGARQSAYRIIVKSLSDGGLKEVWDSGFIRSSKPRSTYAGPSLSSFTEYVWSLEVFGKNNTIYEPISGTFETGMMEMSDWQGSWISDDLSADHRPASMFRHSFGISKPVRKARLYIATAGLHDLSLNGQAVTDEFLNPVFTRYDKRILYNVYDITEALTEGENVFGAILGNGWYNHQPETDWDFDKAIWRNRPVFIANLRITFKDGTEQIISTNERWKHHESPVNFNSIFLAESYDFRKEIPGWNAPAFDDINWSNAKVTSSPTRLLRAQLLPPIQRTEAFKPIKFERKSPRRYVYHFPINMAGITELKVQGTPGTKLRIIHSEQLGNSGSANNSHFQHVYKVPRVDEEFQTDIVILDDGPLTFSPRFNYKGFQYVEIISDQDIILTEDDLMAYRIHSDMKSAGLINTSNSLINKIWKASNNSYLSNMVGYPTDCPQREKNGWTGDGHIMAESGLFNFQSILLYEKWLRDHKDAQGSLGNLPLIIPTGDWGYDNASLDWTSSVILVPWSVYLMTGDDRILRESFVSMKKFLELWEGESENQLLSGGFGDWLPANTRSDKDFTASAYYYQCVQLFSQISLVLREQNNHNYYRNLSYRIRKAINDNFFNTSTNLYATGTQTELSIALDFGLVDEQHKAAVIKNLSDLVAANDNYLDVGLLGSKSLLDALTDNGLEDQALSMVTKTDFPSWGHWINLGLTSFPETWHFFSGQPYTASMNHAFFGEVNSWFFKSLGGIHPSISKPGFEEVNLKPLFDFNMGETTVSHDSPFGIIETHTSPRDSETYEYTVQIPPGSSANLSIPTGFTIVDFKGGNITSAHIPQRVETGHILFSSGTYSFTFSKSGTTPYPFPELVQVQPVDNQDYGNIKIENGHLIFEQGSIPATDGQISLIDVTGKTLSDLQFFAFGEETFLLDLTTQIGHNTVVIANIYLRYEDGFENRVTKRILNTGN